MYENIFLKITLEKKIMLILHTVNAQDKLQPYEKCICRILNAFHFDLFLYSLIGF